MKANRHYELLVHRGSRLPAVLASPDRLDHVEVFWDTAPSQTGRLARALRSDLAQLEADAFVARWRRFEAR
jgi:hypothetical protein